MDGTSGISDAEMRLITVNGQTIMLEGDFDNINMTNEFLNEMLLTGNCKTSLADECSIQADANSCSTCEKDTNNGSSKLELSNQEDNNGLQMVQIEMEEAKALGLFLNEYKNNEGSQYLSCSQDRLPEDFERKMNGETCRVNVHSVPLASVEQSKKDSEIVLEGTDVVKHLNEPEYNSGAASVPIGHKILKQVQDDSIDGLPAIGHLEGFQIPTSEDELLLPATANAKMMDGSYQTITLIPQVVNGAITYTVHFSNLPKVVLDEGLKSANSFIAHETKSINENSATNVSVENEITSVEEFLSSVHLVKDNEIKKVKSEKLLKKNNTKTIGSGLVSPVSESYLLKNNNATEKSGIVCEQVLAGFANQHQLPIDAKIDNLISENENVISRCKKLKYGKKVKTIESDSSPLGMLKISKGSVSKIKKVKFKEKTMKLLSEDTQKKRFKLSLLKPNNDYRPEVISKRGQEMEKEKGIGAANVPLMNLNGRLEFPNLKAIDAAVPSLSYLKVKSSQMTKQPYFNVLPYPKNKAIPVQKQIFPLNCDIQQAKNLISLQKFLESQKLQLKIQPIVSNGNKTINIRPKPCKGEVTKQEASTVNSKQVFNEIGMTEKLLTCEGAKDVTQEEKESDKKSHQNDLNVNDLRLNEGKLNSFKFLKQHSPKCNGEEGLKEAATDSANKSNGIFIKNNPEYFNQKLKNGNDDEHPLGSSENPIQLVQTGHTFHSRQPLSEAQLQQIASILQKQKFDSPSVKKNSIFDPKTNTRIVYRVVYPEDVDLKEADKGPCVNAVSKKKRGRHKGRQGSCEDENQKKPSPMARGPGRPKKMATSVVEDDLVDEEVEEATPKKKIPRTRSGRLSRPPRYMIKDYKRLHNSETSEKSRQSNSIEPDEMYTSYTNGKHVPSLERTENLSSLELDSNLLPGLRPQQRSKRNFKPEYRCPTCQKIYLGHTRMMWHLNKFPDHCNVEKYKENYYRKRTETKVRRAARRLNMCDVTNKVKQVLSTMEKDELTSFCGPLLADALTTWDFLLLRVNLMKKDRKDEVDALIQELIFLLEKLTKVAEDIFLPVFSKESERDEDCVEIDRMEVAIALGLPVGFYKINNDNLNLLRYQLTNEPQETMENEKESVTESTNEEVSLSEVKKEQKLFPKKIGTWKGEEERDSSVKKSDDVNSFWLKSEVNDRSEDLFGDQVHDSVKTLSTKFEPNLSSAKLLESSSDSLDDGKYEESAPLIGLDSDSKDVDRSSSSGNPVDSRSVPSKTDEREASRQNETEDRASLWRQSSGSKVPDDLWSGRDKSPSGIWTGQSSSIPAPVEKVDDHIWSGNTNLSGAREKVDETNSEFLESLLSVPPSNDFEAGTFLSRTISFEGKEANVKEGERVSVIDESKGKRKWRGDSGGEDGGNDRYLGTWDEEKNWPKEEALLTGSVQEKVPGPRTGARLTSTPESNGNEPFSISARRNSISDFSNISLESNNLDVVLPSAKSLMKGCLKSDERKFQLKPDAYLERTENYKVKNWQEDSGKSDFTSTNVNSEDLMKMALESLASQHDVITGPPSGFDTAMGILNQNQENLFASGETDALDFNLPLPDHLLRSNFEQESGNNFQNGESTSFLSTTNAIFGPSCAAIKFDDQFESNFPDKKGKSFNEVMEFFEEKASFNGFGAGNSAMNNFSFSTEPRPGDAYRTARGALESPGKKKRLGKSKKQVPKRARKGSETKKVKGKKAVDYPKKNSIESIINEALFDSQPSPLQIKHSSPNGGSSMTDATSNYSLPIIASSLDEVGNLDFLGQD